MNMDGIYKGKILGEDKAYHLVETSEVSSRRVRSEDKLVGRGRGNIYMCTAMADGI